MLLYIHVPGWICRRVQSVSTMSLVTCCRCFVGDPVRWNGAGLRLQNGLFRYIWFRVQSNHPAFSLVILSLSLAPSNGNWQTGFRCKYKCHRNYGGETSANKQHMRVCVHENCSRIYCILRCRRPQFNLFLCCASYHWHLYFPISD